MYRPAPKYFLKLASGRGAGWRIKGTGLKGNFFNRKAGVGFNGFPTSDEQIASGNF